MVNSVGSAPVLVLSSEPALRQSLSRDLARTGFETIPAVSGEEAERFFGVLAPQLVIAPLSEYGEDGFIRRLASSPGQTTLALIGDVAEQENLLPRSVVYVAARHLSPKQLSEKILLLLLGKRLGLATDHTVECLVGSLQQKPFLELLRDLVDSGRNAHIHLGADGDCWTRSGEAVAARLGRIVGEKAFCRLARRQEGAFQIRPCDDPVESNISLSWDELMTQAINESLISLPDPNFRLALHLRDGFFNREYSGLDQRIFGLAQQGRTVREALDLPAAADGLIAERLQDLVRSGVLALEAPLRPLRIVTDSTADLPTSVYHRHGIVAVPLTVHFGNKAFRDRVDIQPKDFYQLLEKETAHPHSNPPSEGHFEKVFSELVGDSDVLAVHLSKKMSQTAEIASSAAAKQLAGPQSTSRHRIKIVDSRQVSVGLGLLAVLASRYAAQSTDLDRLAQQVEGMSSRIKTLFAVDTLVYLERGGRINKARAWLGSLLKVKPILGLEAGEVVPVDRVRGGRAAYPRLVELLAERVDPSRKILVMVAHANAPQWADRLRGLLEERFDVIDTVQVVEMGPVVGTHTGPGTVGVAAYQPLAEELPLLTDISI